MHIPENVKRWESPGRAGGLPKGNYALAKVLSEQLHKSRGTTWRKELADELRALIEIARTRYDKNPNFRDAAAEPDCLLVQLLAKPETAPGKINGETAAIISKYRDAGLRGTSPRQTASIQEHLDFILEVLAPAHTKLRAALEKMRKAI